MIKEMRDLSWAKHPGGLENGPRGVWKGIRTELKQVSRFLLVAALLSPGYWLLAGVAAIKAVVQLIRHPFRGKKKIHGFRADPGQQVVAEPPVGALTARERVP